MSQTVHAVYWKYEYCIYLNKNKSLIQIFMHNEQSLH